MYEVKHVDPHDDYIESYFQQIQTCSSQQVDSQEIIQLRHWLETSEERLSTSEEWIQMSS